MQIHKIMRNLIAMVFGVVAIAGGLIAAAPGAPDDPPALPFPAVQAVPNASQPNNWLASAGLAVGAGGGLGVIGSLINAFFADRKDARIAELRRLAITNHVRRNTQGVSIMHRWSADELVPCIDRIRAQFPNMPALRPPPALPFDDPDDSSMT